MQHFKPWRCGTRGFAVLSYSWAGGQRPEEAQKVCVMMHGILGSKSNWNTPSRHLLKSIGPQGWRILQLDHRAHGRSPAGSPPHNLDACALDVLDTLKEAGVRRDAELIVCGHSFGGKVALAVLEALQAQGTPPRKTWIFDSVPGCPAALPAEEERREQSVGFVFKVVQSTSGQQFAERADLVRHLQSHGLSQPLAEWIAQSVRSTPEGFELSYDIDVVGQLYAAYQGKDMWHLFKGPADAWLALFDKPNCNDAIIPPSSSFHHLKYHSPIRLEAIALRLQLLPGCR
ncbi:unnamed protein product [Durusdinium trenchii]|uniref:AB hydrolase-1 domain-containing protein n=1 Tax=Durusdinium trenchii TaxID=1381693 RepID=A0ABP0RZ97_9DINO